MVCERRTVGYAEKSPARASAMLKAQLTTPEASAERIHTRARMKETNYQLLAALDETQGEAINVHLRGFNRAHNAAFYKVRDLPENAIRPLYILDMTPRARSWAD